MVAVASTFLRPGPIRVPGPSDRRASSPPAVHLPSPRSPSPAASATATAAAYARVSTPRPTSAPPPAPTLYDVLGLPAGATADEIKSAYRRLARSCHPDAGAAAEEFMRVHAAYSTLSDPDKRADYDRRMLRPLRRSLTSPRVAAGGTSGHGHGHGHAYAGAGASLSGLRRRTWETDQCW